MFGPSAHAPVVVHHEQGPANYNYGYAVADSYSGVNFGATEAHDGYATPMFVPKLLATMLEMITPDMLLMFNTLVNPHLMLLQSAPAPPCLNI